MEEEHLQSQPQRLGALLAARRESLGLTIDQAATELKTIGRYVRALEAGLYDEFPAKIYALGFLKKYVTFLGAGHPQEYISLFEEEWVKSHKADVSRRPHRRRTRYRTLQITPGRIVWVAGGLLFIGFLGLLSTQLWRFAGTPLLNIEEPQDRFHLDQPVLQVKGRAERESKLTVNGKELTIDSTGTFNSELELQPGVVTLEFLLQNRFGKTTMLVRHGVVE